MLADVPAIIGVFDSGVGGLAVAKAVAAALPRHRMVYANDSINLPYGDRSPDELRQLALPRLVELAALCDVIVVACNTLTMTVLDDLRNAVPVPMVGVEPPLREAVRRSQRGVVAVCATPATLASPGYASLRRQYAAGVTVLEPDCRMWARMVESGKVEPNEIVRLVTDVCRAGADVIVLGCTHYHWIEHVIRGAAAGRAHVVQPDHQVIADLKAVLADTRTGASFGVRQRLPDSTDPTLAAARVELSIQEIHGCEATR